LGLENGVSSGSRIGAAWHYEDEKGFSLQRDLLPATTGKVVLRNFDRPKNIVFPPLKRFIISRRRSNGKQRYISPILANELTKLAAAGGSRVQFSHIDTTSAQLVLLHSKGNSRRAMSNAARPSAYWIAIR
jgi:hypothetical protein